MEESENLYRKLQDFSKINEQFSICFKLVDSQKGLNQSEKVDVLLEYVAKEIFVNPIYFSSVIKSFTKEIPRLLVQAVFFTEECAFNHERHIINCVLLSKIVRIRTDLNSFVLQYLENYPSPFENGPASPLKSKKSRLSLQENITIRDIDLIEACYFLLKSDPKFYRKIWKWSVFIKKYSSSREYEVAWLSCHTTALVLGLNEANLKSLLAQRIPEDVNLNLTIEFDKNSGFARLSQSNSHAIDQHPHISSQTKSTRKVVSVSGIYISALDKPRKQLLIDVPSTRTNLQKIAIGLSSRKALCLQGSVGSGKTGLIEHLAACSGRKLGDSFVKVQLGDQTDSKMLLGTYRCTDTPGEFIWQPGVLTQAVTQGNWLLLEDIDLASMDIASVLASLLENNALSVPGYRDLVPVTPGFQLFLTQRLMTTVTGHHKHHSNALNLLEKQLLQITIDPLTISELKQILHEKYPQFDTVADKLLKVFQLVSVDKNSESLSPRKSGRLISTRDFFKWCSRAAIGFNVKSQESTLKTLQEAIDVFCCSIPDFAESLELAKDISTQLGIINHKAEYFLTNYKPTMKLASDSFQSARVSLQREHSIYSKQAKFCFTRPAAVLLERIMCCVKLREPVLLVGETGTGKTSSVQYLAHTLGKKLIVINMNQQSDSADLLGGFKPVDMKIIMGPVHREFEQVFRDYFDTAKNKEFLDKVAFAYNKQKYALLVSFMQKSSAAALKRLTNVLETGSDPEKSKKDQAFLKRWRNVNEKLKKLEVQLKQGNALYFAFIEGSLVKAVQEGSWVLLDEINLANAETLECLSGLLEDTSGSLCLLERGDKKPVKRHPNFTLFACMNPATNIGKKDLPVGLRNRFTEFYVDELTEKTDLSALVNNYLEAMSLKDGDIMRIVNFYLRIRKEMEVTLCDGLGHKPHFSLRSLCRALMIAAKNPCGTFKKSLYEAFCLSFLTQLDSTSYRIVQQLIASSLIGEGNKLKAVLKQPMPEPKERGSSFLKFEDYWVKKGKLQPDIPDNYILTNSVRKNLKDLARVVSIGKLPVLLQGDTSVGKTSLITYLAKSSGNKCVRINNHEHTDLQEYIGSYVADATGKLVFREGVLVEAMRKGHWIILDELNLAPTDVLEALNRVLDDNRELFIPETQETVKADPNFMLFATQNPPGAYGGRKMLSRAFRNRFVELHFNEIPAAELEFILHQRCAMSTSYARKMILVMTDLQLRRRGSAAFAGKQGFITLRDLFRWGERYRLANNSTQLYDWDQHLVDEGYLVLAGKVRKNEEREEIITVLQTHWKREVQLENLFSLHDNTSNVTRHILQKIDSNSARYPNIVWTYNMRKLAVLVAKALEFKEPVLLVGETGGGKTTICQLIAENQDQDLIGVNCHMHTESSDFIGGLRPVRDHSSNSKSLFEWVDGPLLEAMTKGSFFLADEISLADDSVLERLNSLLEPERTLLLAEKGIDLNNPNNSETVVAHPNFVFIGTMNPGGDFGKKELSPALRNRFTEIWCDSCSDRNDLTLIINKNLKIQSGENFGEKMMDFIDWFKSTEIGKRFTLSIRDILTWTNFINISCNKISVNEAYLHGAHLVFLDGLGSGATSTENMMFLSDFKKECEKYLSSQVNIDISKWGNTEKVINTETHFGIEPFFIPSGHEKNVQASFSFDAQTTVFNALKLLRGMQLNKAILLEGSPGVGKTSLVTALAKFSRHKIFRVNLSDQTDISDLFGADLPVEGGTGGQFSWRDGPLLQALKEGSWILLDELNLASQSVLEGLNACLDHRGEIFIPELGKRFHVKIGTRFFACQNPMKQGGSRRGLPKSFLNRFIQVYISPFTSQDTETILSNQFPSMPKETLSKMIEFNYTLSNSLDRHLFGNKGAPWECNLRDLTRWCQATLYHFEISQSENKKLSPESTAQLIYIHRMRTEADRKRVEEIFQRVTGFDLKGSNPTGYIDNSNVYFGDVHLKRGQDEPNDHILEEDHGHLLLRGQMGVLRSLTYCVNQNWMAIVVGNSGVGKSSAVKTLANLAGKTLKTLPVTSAMDTTDILGGFEQTNYSRHLEEIAKETERQTLTSVRNLLLEEKPTKAAQLLEYWEEYLAISDSITQTMEDEVRLFERRLTKLEALLKELYMKCDSTNVGNTILKLLNKCSNIWEFVKQDKSLSAGGRFEWIDSILVKCLQEGSWLLVENVNLCSAAVLDRLNALLEPNGVLTISERGVDENGKMFEIKPHKDFRIFLTMDPKNGEISRAMRNRGIEIYMLNDTETATSNLFDIQSQIYFEGLSNPRLINALLRIHEFIAGLILSGKPGSNEIIQCSSLVSQQLRHGLEVADAFYNTCIEVYYKTRNSSEFNCNNVLEVIREGIQRCLSENTPNSFNPKVTLNTKNLARWSTLEKVKQQCSSSVHEMNDRKGFYKYFQETMSKSVTDKQGVIMDKSKDLTIWSDIETVKRQRELFDSTNFYTFANLLVINYALTSQTDIECRTAYLKNFVQQSEWQETIERFSKVTKYFDCKNVNLPYDDRWVNVSSINNTTSNAINYAFQVEIHKLRDLLEVKHSKTKSLYKYLLALKANVVVDDFNSPICTNYLELRSQHFVFMRQLFAFFVKRDEEGTFVRVLELLSWRQALHGFLTAVRLPDERLKSPKVIESKLDIMMLYYKWFYKYSVQSVAQLLNAEIPRSLEEVLLDINEKMEEQFSKGHKTASNYKKINNVPEFFTSQLQIEALNLLQSFDIHSTNSKETLALFKTCPEQRSRLIKLKTLAYRGSNELEVEMKKGHFTSPISTERSLLAPQELEILPLIDKLTQMLLTELIKGIETKSGHLDHGSLANNILVKVDFDGALLNYNETDDKRLLHEIKKEFYSGAANSPSARLEKFIDGPDNDVIGLSIAGIEPTFLKTITRLVVPLDGKCTTLSNFRDVDLQRKSLGLLLWDNMHAMAEERFDFVWSQRQIVDQQAKSFIRRLQEALKLPKTDLQNFPLQSIRNKTLKKIVEHIKNAHSHINQPDLRKKDRLLSDIGDLHLNIAFAEICINSCLPRIDPLAKKAMKKNHINSIISMFEQMLKSFELQNSIFSNEEECRHPYVRAIKEKIVDLKDRLKKYGDSFNVGVKCYSYGYVAQQITHATKNLLDASILDSIRSCTKLIQNFGTSDSIDEAQESIQHSIKVFQSSISCYEKIFQDWKQYSSSYPDIVEPLLANLAQYLYGFKLKLFWIKREFVKLKYEVHCKTNIESELLKLAALPSLNQHIQSLDVLVDSYTNQRRGCFISHILCEESIQVQEMESVRLLKCEIQECFNQCVINVRNYPEIDAKLLNKFHNLISIFINVYNKQQDDKEKEKAESESLYKIRTKCDDKSEEEQIEDDIKELFPNHHDLDFSDLQEKSLSDPVIRQNEQSNVATNSMTEEDLRFVINLHSELFKNFIRAEWIVAEQDKNVGPNFVGPLMEKFKLVRRLIDRHPNYFRYTLDAKLSSSFAVLLDLSRNYCITDGTPPSSPRISTKRSKDFYKDSDVAEVKTCHHILENLKIKTKTLLEEWPDQPTLNSILTIIDRIQHFNIESPISRYLTGMDILLAKCYEWEQVAHSGVSLIQDTPELVAQIINWRKLELSRWKDLLNSTFDSLSNNLSKWWLYMYNVLRQYASEQVTESELVDTLQKFISKSTIVEFRGRLDLIFEFHCHALTLSKSSKLESFISILWNLYNYFKQFSGIIANKIKDLRSPIERKLKDYVKIVRWKDVNYWSVKDTVEKMHKTLYKFVKEYKVVLLQPVTPYLSNLTSDSVTESVGIWDRPKRQNPKAYHYTLDADSYIVKGHANDSAYLLKARKICKETIVGTSYPELVKSLDGFITDIIETSSHLNKLEVDTKQPKEKQVSHAKSILQQKHRALADLFQTLTKIGVSYKTGLMERKLKQLVDDFTIKPINLSASFSYLGLNRTDEKILTIWDSCELYYYRSLIRYDVLETALVTPSRDLGMQNIERCKGFAAHLLNISQQQKRNLIETTRAHYILRTYAKQMREACDHNSFITSKTLTEIRNMLNSLTVVINQVELILESCPQDTSFDNKFIEAPVLDPTSNKMRRKEDENWKKAANIINTINATKLKILQLIQKFETCSPHTDKAIVRPNFVPLPNKEQLFEDLQKLGQAIRSLKLIFEPIVVVESLDWLESTIESIISQNKEDNDNTESSEKLETVLDGFTKLLLITMQNIYKQYKKSMEDADRVSEEQLEEKHLSNLIAGKLSEDIALFNLTKIVKRAERCLKSLLGGDTYISNEIKSRLLESVSLFDQVLQLCQYFITQQVAAYRTVCKLNSILLNIFIDLASKGFCIPPELSDEMDKEGISKPSDGLGLGDGQGERDVSDKIESEDQLDDAQPAGQEKEKNDDPDCNEEDNGIEMSEDFESHLQDKKPGEDEDDEQSDNSDAEEQMGETEKGADQLDKEIWGDDQEENDNGDNDKEEEDGKAGEKDGEDQLEAKNDKSKQAPKDKNSPNDQTETSEENKEEINEMNEPDYDDEQIDPYHGNQTELPEPEPMDLPDDLQLDEGEENDEEQPQENPFDIDEMKDQKIPEDKPEELSPENKEEKQNDEVNEFSSDDEEAMKQDNGDDVEDESGENIQEENDLEPSKSQEDQDSADESEGNKEDSALDENPSNQENIEAMEVEDASATDKTQATQSDNLKSNQPIEETYQEDKPDKEGVGQSQMEESESGHSVQSHAQREARSSRKDQEELKKDKKERPGQSDLKRSLGDVNKSVEKRLKTVDAIENDKPETELEEKEADMYQHIKEANETAAIQVLDAATKEQAEEQNKEITHQDNENEEIDGESRKDVPEDEVDEMEIDTADTQVETSVKKEKSSDKSKPKKQHPEGEILDEIQDINVEGDIVKTSTVPRGGESFHHTHFHLLQNDVATKLTQSEINAIRSQVNRELSSWKSVPSSTEAEQAWQKISAITSSLAQDLSEQLRLVLEPTQASHLKGDFRTGRRINMRKVIPYIASQFRKDKIWLRRTKPSKREYQIVLAIDDSSSMADNQCKELTFESVALISKALSLLESGQLGVVSFGESTEIHHKLTEPFTDKCGIELLQSFQFAQQKTYIGKLMEFVTEMFEQGNVNVSIPNAKLLLIVSDGRGVFFEGKNYVTQAIRRAKLANIFIVFVIIDDPKNQSSVLDIKSTTFENGKLLNVQSYMDEFPFSFYLILRDIKSLPGVLSDALMQWFEMVTQQ